MPSLYNVQKTGHFRNREVLSSREIGRFQLQQLHLYENTTVVKYRKLIPDQSPTELQQLQLYGNQDLEKVSQLIV